MALMGLQCDTFITAILVDRLLTSFIPCLTMLPYIFKVISQQQKLFSSNSLNY